MSRGESGPRVTWDREWAGSSHTSWPGWGVFTTVPPPGGPSTGTSSVRRTYSGSNLFTQGYTVASITFFYVSEVIGATAGFHPYYEYYLKPWVNWLPWHPWGWSWLWFCCANAWLLVLWATTFSIYRGWYPVEKILCCDVNRPINDRRQIIQELHWFYGQQHCIYFFTVSLLGMLYVLPLFGDGEATGRIWIVAVIVAALYYGPEYYQLRASKEGPVDYKVVATEEQI